MPSLLSQAWALQSPHHDHSPSSAERGQLMVPPHTLRCNHSSDSLHLFQVPAPATGKGGSQLTLRSSRVTHSTEQHHLLASYHLTRNITTKQVTARFKTQTRALFIVKGGVTGNYARTVAHKFRLSQTDGEVRFP